jgi:hypothetical protein
MDEAAARARMVDAQLRGIADPRVLDAMRTVPRHEFVPPALRPHAYDDGPLPIGHGQTISQPYVVALMCELAALDPTSSVLEVGAGCGYQAAVLGRLARTVVSLEIVAPLAHDAAARLARLGFANVEVRHDDGHGGRARSRAVRRDPRCGRGAPGAGRIAGAARARRPPRRAGRRRGAGAAGPLPDGRRHRRRARVQRGVRTDDRRLTGGVPGPLV